MRSPLTRIRGAPLGEPPTATEAPRGRLTSVPVAGAPKRLGRRSSGGARVLIVSQIFLPEMGALANRLYPLARHLRGAGHEVLVATGMPNYPEGRVFDGYRGRWAMRERIDDVTVLRTRSWVTERNASKWGQLASYLSFLPAAFLSGMRAGRVDVVFVTSPPLFPVLPAAAIARLRGARLVLDLRDLWPDEIVACEAATESSLPVRAMRRLERWAYRRADRVACTTPAFLETVAARGVPAERLVFLPNGADLERFRPLPRDNPAAQALGLGDRFAVVYSGLLGIKHGLEAVIDAAERLSAHPDVVVVLIGEGPRRAALEAAARERGLTNVVFAGQRHIDQLPHLLARADVCVTNLLPDPYLEKIIPVKVFEYMACGRPVVAGLRGEGARVVEEAGGGIVVPPGDGAAMAKAVLALRDDPATAAAMAARGRRYVEERYSRAASAARLEAVVRELAGMEAGGGPGADGALAVGEEAA